MVLRESAALDVLRFNLQPDRPSFYGHTEHGAEECQREGKQRAPRCYAPNSAAGRAWRLTPLSFDPLPLFQRPELARSLICIMMSSL